MGESDFRCNDSKRATSPATELSRAGIGASTGPKPFAFPALGSKAMLAGAIDDSSSCGGVALASVSCSPYVCIRRLFLSTGALLIFDKCHRARFETSGSEVLINVSPVRLQSRAEPTGRPLRRGVGRKGRRVQCELREGIACGLGDGLRCRGGSPDCRAPARSGVRARASGRPDPGQGRCE